MMKPIESNIIVSPTIILRCKAPGIKESKISVILREPLLLDAFSRENN